MKRLKYYGELIHSDKPKWSMIYCLVPGCTKETYLTGSSQGFTRYAAGSQHGYAHWRDYHKEQGHKTKNYDLCPECMKAADEKWMSILQKKGIK